MNSRKTNLILPLYKSVEDVTRCSWMCIAVTHGDTIYDALLFNRNHKIIYDQKHDRVKVCHCYTPPAQIRWWSGINGNELCSKLKSSFGKEYFNGKDPKKYSVDYEKPEVVTLCAKYHLTVGLPAYTTGCLTYTCRMFETFTKQMLKYFLSVSSGSGLNCDIISESDSLTQNATKYIINISLLEDDKVWLDYKWDVRIGCLVWKRMMLDDAMSWLNTLGGGYSALGDYFVHHAESAGQISIRQLKIALDLGDPPTVLRCYLYFAISLMQRGFLRRSKYIIRRSLSAAKGLPVDDFRLQAMCYGIWSRLKYLYIQRAKRRAVLDLKD